MTVDAQLTPFPFKYQPEDRVMYIANPGANYSRWWCVPGIVVAVIEDGKYRVRTFIKTPEGGEIGEVTATRKQLGWRQRPCRALGEPHPRYDEQPITIYDEFTGAEVMRFPCYEDYEAALVWANTTSQKEMIKWGNTNGVEIYRKRWKDYDYMEPVEGGMCAAMMRYAETYKANAAARREAATIRT